MPRMVSIKYFDGKVLKGLLRSSETGFCEKVVNN